MAYYDEDFDVVRGNIEPGNKMVVSPYYMSLSDTNYVELELDGEFIEIPVQWIPELIAVLAEAYRRATNKELQIAIDARRYQFLRVEDKWGEDSGDDCWERLGESDATGFDEIVDSRMANSERGLQE